MTAKSKLSKGSLTSVPQSVIQLLDLHVGDYLEWAFTKDTSYVLVRKMPGETVPKQGEKPSPSPTPSITSTLPDTGESGESYDKEQNAEHEKKTFAERIATGLHYDPVKPGRFDRIRRVQHPFFSVA